MRRHTMRGLSALGFAVVVLGPTTGCFLGDLPANIAVGFAAALFGLGYFFVFTNNGQSRF